MPTRQTHHAGWTLLETLVVLVVILIAIGVLLPMLSVRPRINSRRTANTTQLRGIHQGMHIFAQSNQTAGQDGYFPGLDASGGVVPNGPETGYSGEGTEPAARLWMMLDGRMFTPEYLINPADPIAKELTSAPVGPGTGSTSYTPLRTLNHSYALLGLLAENQRGEWKETFHTGAIVAGNRAIGTGPADLSSVWTRPRSGDWRGGIVRNDNSTSFETTAEFDTRFARPDGTVDHNPVDHLFEDDPAKADAFLVHDDAGTAYSLR